MKLAIGVLLCAAPGLLLAQGTKDDYQRAQSFREKFQGLAVNIPGPSTWVGDSTRFWYRKSVKGGNEFVVVDAQTLSKAPAFDHQKLAAALAAAGGGKYSALTLPFDDITFADNSRAIEFAEGGSL